MNGRIHSIETSGMVDGPGIRYVIFTQGCLLRCQYCHNPDSWDREGGEIRSVSSLVTDIKKYWPYMKHSNGGVTVSGGEPLLQIDFLIELFKQLKENGIHTTIDSSGGCFSSHQAFQDKLDELLQYTDLVLLDLKHIDDKKHKHLTGMTNKHILEFAKTLSNKNVPLWIRHVLVPGISDDTEDLKQLSSFINTLENVKKVEVLPYHKMGVYKWKELGLSYPLEGVEPPDDAKTAEAKRILQLQNT